MERNNRKVYTGTVVSTKMDKTITVLVETHVKHKLYGKRMKSSTKFHAHDENNTAQVGDTVKIMSTRPLSATKRFRLVEIVKKAEVPLGSITTELSSELSCINKGTFLSSSSQAKTAKSKIKTTHNLFMVVRF